MKWLSLSPGLLAFVASVSDCSACRRGPPPILFPTFETSVQALDASEEPDVSTRDVQLRATQAENVPLPGTQLTVDGLAVTAPPGFHFVQYLAIDLDQDGDRDLLASTAKDRSPANVAAFRRNAADWSPIDVTGAQAASPNCRPDKLVAYSPSAFFVRYGACDCAAGESCPGLIPVVSEALAITFDGTSFITKQRATEVGPRLGNASVQLEALVYDHDSDGRDDVTFSVSVGGSDPAVAGETAMVALLDRGTGFARDVTEPSASIARMASSIRAAASTRRRAPDALRRITSARNLYRVLCREAGAPRVRISGELGLQCGNLFGSLSEATGRAYLSLGEFAAAAAMQRPDTAGDWGPVTSERFDADLQRATPSETGITARQGPLLGVATDTLSIRGSALRFDPPGPAVPTHIALSGPQTGRVELLTLGAEPPATGTLADLLPSNLEHTQTVVGAFNTCQGVMLARCPSTDNACIEAGTNGQLSPSATLHAVSPIVDLALMARCGRDDSVRVPLARDPRLQWVGWGSNTMFVSWSGRLLSAQGTASSFTPVTEAVNTAWAPGSGASRSGIAIAGTDAIFVRDITGRVHAWRPPQLQGRYRQLTDLTLSDDGRTMAARLSTTLWVIERLTATP